jgi:penicillin V acylase-like amidase (Ntn superfamily)
MRHYVAVGLLVSCASSVARPAGACSNFFFDANGYSLMAHDMDWVSGEGMVVINKRHVQKRGFQVENDPEFSWTSRYGSISLTFDGRESTGRGMNEVGLVILEAALSDTRQSSDHGLPLLSVAQWTQYQLDTSATVEDVIASDNVVRIWPDDMQSHFIVRDKSGAMAIIEWLDGQMTVYRDGTLPVPATVNSTYESCLETGDDPSGRFKRIVDALAAYDATTDADGLGYVYSMLLNDLRNQLPPPVETLWSVVFDLNAMRLYISTVQNSELRYVDFGDFDFSCQTPVEVLDINGPGSGNVRSAFVPYTTAFNDMMVRRTYDIYSSYGQTTSEDVLEKIIAFPDTTTCADGATGGAGAGTGGTANAGAGAGGAPSSAGATGGSVGATGGSLPSAGSGGSMSGGGTAGAAHAGAQARDAAGSGAGGSGGNVPQAGGGRPDAGAGAARGSSSADAASGCSCRLAWTRRRSEGLASVLIWLGVLAGRRQARTVSASRHNRPLAWSSRS